MITVLLAVAGLAAVAVSASARPARSLAASAAPQAPLGHSGRWLTDRQGRVVILHGLNMVYKRAPYTPSTTGFGADDAAFLRRFGFNTIRLGLIYAGVEPSPGRYDGSYLANLRRTERTLGRQGVFSQIDFHQDLYNERFEGEGWPDWAVQDDGLPAEPKAGFPANYIGMPALSRAFDHFWANDAGPGVVGLQDRYAAAWRRVAAGFRNKPHVMGYDLMNEPWPGTPWPTCASTAGCPGFDQGAFTDFYRRVIAGIRKADGRSLIWYEPNVLFNFGSDTNLGRLGDPRLGFSFHDYCLAAAAGVPGGGPACEASEDMVFQNADEHAGKTGSALLLSEFGATDDLTSLSRTVAAADKHMVPWQEWHYCGCDDPTTSGPGTTQALVLDPAKPPRRANVRQAKLRVLVRPYPQAIAGTPSSFSFDPPTRRFTLRYSKARASGRRCFRRGLTDVFVPKLRYPNGYRVVARGATVVSKPGRQHLILRGNRRSRAVSVTVTRR